MSTKGYQLQNSDNSVPVTGLLVLPKASGNGIQVDTATPTFGFRDILGPLQLRGGATNPAFNTYRDGLFQYQFSVADNVFLEYHLPHDYVLGTDIFCHPHWSHTSTVVTGGSVTWGYEMSYAKGHNQAAFPATKTITGVSNASTTRYQHILTDVQISVNGGSGTQLDSSTFEPDGLILLRFYLSANNITVSSGGAPAPFVHFVDLHYQSSNIATKARAPNFYA